VVVVTTHRYIAINYPHRVKKLASLRVARYQASFCLLHGLTLVMLHQTLSGRINYPGNPSGAGRINNLPQGAWPKVT